MMREQPDNAPILTRAARPATRRHLLRWAGVLGAGGGALALLAACGGTAGVSVGTGSAASTASPSSAPSTSAAVSSSAAPSTASSSASAGATSSSASAGSAASAATSASSASSAPLAITAVPSQTAASASSSAGGSAAAAGKAGTLIIGRGGDSVGLDPGAIEDGESVQVTQEIYDSLVRYDRKQPPLTIVPALASAWEISPDNLQITFHLRQGVKFHDGTDFNADAVVFSFARQSDPSNPYNKGSHPYYKENFGDPPPGNLKSVEKVDDATVKFTLAKPDGEILPKLSLFAFAIVSPTAAKKDPEGFTRNPVGTGPFMFKEWIKGDHITLVKNPNYWEGPAKLDTMIFRVIPDNSARAAEMQAGSIQSAGTEIAAVDIPAMQKNPDIQVIEQPAVSTGYLAFNQSDAKFKDLKVRQAFAYAINRKAIIDAFYGQQGEVPTQFQPPAILGYNPDLKYYEYNPDKAKQLLKDAGVSNLTTDFWYMSVTRGYFPDPKAIAQAMAGDLSKVGITVNLKTEDWAAYLKDRTDGKLGLYMLGWGSDNGDPDNYLGYFFSIVKPEFSYDNPTLRDLLTKGDQLIDPKQRAPLYQQAQKIVNDDVPCIPVAWAKGAAVVRKNVQGYTAPLFTEPYHDVSVT